MNRRPPRRLDALFFYAADCRAALERHAFDGFRVRPFNRELSAALDAALASEEMFAVPPNDREPSR